MEKERNCIVVYHRCLWIYAGAVVQSINIKTYSKRRDNIFRMVKISKRDYIVHK